MIPPKEWKWFGSAGHFICGQWCQFHLCTQVGKYLVSTVGLYFPDESTREILASSRGVTLKGRGDARRADYMNKIGYEDIGYNRKLETMVFLAGKPCDAEDCHCGQPATNGTELDFAGYNEAGEATCGHLALCEKWANKNSKR